MSIGKTAFGEGAVVQEYLIPWADQCELLLLFIFGKQLDLLVLVSVASS